jgi:predicted MFS family arabinose efflux permease
MRAIRARDATLGATMPRPASLVSLAFGGLLALAAAMGIGRFVYTPILPFMVEALGLSAAQAGLIASANFAGYLAGALLAATPLTRGSRRRWLLGAIAASGLTTLAMGLVDSLALFLALRFLGGVASAFTLVFASALVLDRLNAAGQPGLSNLHFAGVGAGMAVSALLVFGVEAIGWRAQWIAGGVASVLALLAVARLVPDRGEAPAQAAAAAAPRDGGLAALIVAYGLFGFGYVITATFIVAMVRAMPDTRAIEPLVWLVVGLAAAPSVALWAWLGARIGLAHAFALACLVEAAGVAASVLWLALPGMLLGAALLGGTFMGITALGLVAARRLARGDPRRILAVMTAAFGTGQMVGPVFAGVMHDATGSFMLPSLAAAGALVVASLLATLGLRR